MNEQIDKYLKDVVAYGNILYPDMFMIVQFYLLQFLSLQIFVLDSASIKVHFQNPLFYGVVT